MARAVFLQVAASNGGYALHLIATERKSMHEWRILCRAKRSRVTSELSIILKSRQGTL
jgi:hypothetical protein